MRVVMSSVKRDHVSELILRSHVIRVRSREYSTVSQCQLKVSE